MVEPTDGEVESGELRWPPEEFLVSEEEDEEEEDDDVQSSGGIPNGQPTQNSQHWRGEAVSPRSDLAPPTAPW